MKAPCQRYRIYRAPRRNFLCVVVARDEAHALNVARQNFSCVGKEAFAVMESREDAMAACETLNREVPR